MLPGSKATARTFPRRRPTLNQNKLLLSGIDIQQLPPLGWCPVCGTEVYSQDEDLCSRCIEANTANLEIEYE